MQDIQPRESFLISRDAICIHAMQNFIRRFIPVRLFITEDCAVTYLTYFIIVSRIRSEGSHTRYYLSARILYAGWKNSRS